MRNVLLSLALLTAAAVMPARSQESTYSIALTGTFTTSSHLFYNPESSDGFERSRNLPFNNVFGGGIDFRMAIGSSGVVLGITVDYLKSTDAFEVPATPSLNIPVSDGFEAFPVEGTGYFVVPFSSDRSLLYIGAGGGIYFGRRIYEKAGVSSASVGRTVGAGIHILTGFEYRVFPSIGIRTEVKFRDVSFKATNVFPSSTTVFKGRVVDLGERVNVSRLNIDGMELVAGLVYTF
jgi:hypothetical protein